MLIHSKDGGTITFRHHVGSGSYGGRSFELGVSCTPDGTLLGMPVVSWSDGTTVTFELSDILPVALEAVADVTGEDR